MHTDTRQKSDNGVLEKFADGREVLRLRLLFLAPLAIAIVAITVALMLALYWHEQRLIHQGMLRIRATAVDFYQDSIRYDTSALRAVMDTMQRDPALQAALAARDRQKLLASTADLFEALKQDYAVTHLYFSTPDRVNLLRVHDPGRYGDRIDRATTLAAEKNAGTAVGVELGPLGTLTLRLVAPWYDTPTHQLLGYVELGIEVDRALQKLRHFFGVEVFVLIDKRYLDRAQWEGGMRTLGRNPAWERFPTVVAVGEDALAMPPFLTERLGRGELGEPNNIVAVFHDGASYQMAFLPLPDAVGRNVAHMVLIADISPDINAALHTLYAGGLATLAVGALLLVFFHRQVGLIGRRIEDNERALVQLATHDGLTGLYNHRTFYTLLAEDIARASRYQHSLSLLMVDIDHFKQVNDTHGHQAGDAVLRGLAGRLSAAVRSVDRVCRYGGEEITVILTDSAAPLEMAERLRAAVAATPFDLGGGKAVAISVSIGLSSFPAHARQAAALVAAADAALYAAKQGGRNRVCSP